MTYASGESAALTIIRTVSGLDSTNTLSTANDSTNSGAGLLNSGKSDRYVILYPGPFDSGFANIGETLVFDDWQTVIRIAVLSQPSGGASPYQVLASLRQSIMAALDARYLLNTTGTTGAKIISGEELDHDYRIDNRTFVIQEMVLLWHEERSVTQAD